jgi:hypothetical protein
VQQNSCQFSCACLFHRTPLRFLVRPKQLSHGPHLAARDVALAISLPLVSAPIPCRLALTGMGWPRLRLHRQVALGNGCAATIRDAYALKAFLLKYLYCCQSLPLGRAGDHDVGTTTWVSRFNDYVHCLHLCGRNPDGRDMVALRGARTRQLLRGHRVAPPDARWVHIVCFTGTKCDTPCSLHISRKTHRTTAFESLRQFLADLEGEVECLQPDHSNN